MLKHTFGFGLLALVMSGGLFLYSQSAAQTIAPAETTPVAQTGCGCGKTSCQSSAPAECSGSCGGSTCGRAKAPSACGAF